MNEASAIDTARAETGRGSKFRVCHYPGFAELPERYRPLLVRQAERGFFHSPEWFGLLMAYVFDERDQMRIYAVEADDGSPLLLAPLRYTTQDPAATGAHTIASIGHMENFTVASLIFDGAVGEGVSEHVEILAGLFRHLRDASATEDPPRVDMLRLWPVEVDTDLARVIGYALHAAGFWVQVYANSFNRYEVTAGVDYAAYLATRSANLRYNIRRRQRNLEKAGTLEIRLYCTEEGLEQGIADYVTVSRASWKALPSMLDAALLHLIRLTGRTGDLRLGTLHFDGHPVAVQFWIVTGGIAHCIRLAYDEAYKDRAVGVVLTNYMIAHVLDHDRVDQIDYGYGVEEYKAGWMREARYYAGYMAFNPATPRGRWNAIKHVVGQPIKRLVKGPVMLLRRWLRPEGTSR